MTLDDLNTMPPERAQRELSSCCGCARWTAAMVARRPFGSVNQLYADAEQTWRSLDGADWLEAFSQHPRIGERTSGWPAAEQSGTRAASVDALKRLAELNHEYERKFGHVFLIFASGKSAPEIIDALERRIPNDPATELRVAAAEQEKITRLRLEKLLELPPRR